MWFEVDKDGLARLLERRGKSWVVFELIQNSWDEGGATRVDVTLAPVMGRPLAQLKVEDDSPEGFRDLTHAYTLFAESYKKGNVKQRGRFNLGEKLVLALCESADIVSTRGGVRFTQDGRQSLRRRRERGTVFEAVIRMTREELARVERDVLLLIPPSATVTTFNGQRITNREPVASTAGELTTEVAGLDGVLRRLKRVAPVLCYRVEEGEVGTVYEMGIPVAETDDGFHVNIGQKVPLNMERDALPESYLRDVRALILNATAHLLNPEESAKPWVGDALADKSVSPEAVRQVVTLRYGENRVGYDPSDTEANRRAVAEGHVIIHGGAFSAEQWENIKGAGAVTPAGQKFPTPKPFGPNGEPLQTLPLDDWTADHLNFAEFARRMSEVTIRRAVTVQFVLNEMWNSAGAFGPDCVLYVSNARFLETVGKAEQALDFLTHEFGHVEGDDHLSTKYHGWLTKIAARLALWLAFNPKHLRLLGCENERRIGNGA